MPRLKKHDVFLVSSTYNLGSSFHNIWIMKGRWERGGSLDIGNITLMRMFKNLFGITPYFFSKLDVLDISKNIQLLLDIIAIIQFLFHHCNPSIKGARILQVILLFSF